MASARYRSALNVGVTSVSLTLSHLQRRAALDRPSGGRPWRQRGRALGSISRGDPRCSRRRAPRRERRGRRAGHASCHRRPSASAIASTSVGSNRRAESPVSSGKEVVFEHVTGTPAVNASSTGKPKPSNSDGKTKHRADAYRRASVSGVDMAAEFDEIAYAALFRMLRVCDCLARSVGPCTRRARACPALSRPRSRR